MSFMRSLVKAANVPSCVINDIIQKKQSLKSITSFFAINVKKNIDNKSRIHPLYQYALLCSNPHQDRCVHQNSENRSQRFYLLLFDFHMSGEGTCKCVRSRSSCSDSHLEHISACIGMQGAPIQHMEQPVFAKPSQGPHELSCSIHGHSVQECQA